MGIFLIYINYDYNISKILYFEIFCVIINLKLPSQVGVRQLVTGLIGIILFITACYFIFAIKFPKEPPLSPVINSNKAMDDYIAQVSHDLKSPAVSLLNAVKLLLAEDYGKLSSAQKTLLEVAYESCIYENNLIATILDSYKYDNGLLSISYDKFNILELLAEIEKGLSTQLNDKMQNLKITNNLSENYILGDRLHLKRVITNFLTNAATYSTRGSEIEITLNIHNNMFEIDVLNKSLVKPTENMNLVFEKFKTFKNSQYNKTSVGLGLYLSKQIIEAHHGKIYARIEPDDRCLFGFRIPIEIPKKTTNQVTK